MSEEAVRILVASDFSDLAAVALRQAAARARSLDGVLAVCRVLARSWDVFPDRYASEAGGRAAADDRVREEVRNAVISITSQPPTSFEVFVEHGTTYAEVVRRAESWRATLAVVGSHGRSGTTLGGLLSGVAVKVARYAP